jgi:hypothetical protein
MFYLFVRNSVYVHFAVLAYALWNGDTSLAAFNWVMCLIAWCANKLMRAVEGKAD